MIKLLLCGLLALNLMGCNDHTEECSQLAKEIFDNYNPNADEFFILGFNYAHDLMAFKYMAMINALKQINEEELNSQRPGGGHSRSATLSYEALKLVGEL